MIGQENEVHNQPIFLRLACEQTKLQRTYNV